MKVDLTGPLYSSFETARKEYKEAKDGDDSAEAKKKALECAKILKLLAEKVPSQKESYLEKAGKWERIAASMENLISERKRAHSGSRNKKT